MSTPPVKPTPAPKQEPATTITRTPLSQIQHAKIGKCTAVLGNKSQCWRAGDIQVTIIESVVGDKDNPGETKTTSYQLCRFHNELEQNPPATQQ